MHPRELLSQSEDELLDAAAAEAAKLGLTVEEALDAYEAGALPTDERTLKAILGFLQPKLRKDPD